MSAIMRIYMEQDNHTKAGFGAWISASGAWAFGVTNPLPALALFAGGQAIAWMPDLISRCLSSFRNRNRADVADEQLHMPPQPEQHQDPTLEERQRAIFEDIQRRRNDEDEKNRAVSWNYCELENMINGTETLIPLELFIRVAEHNYNSVNLLVSLLYQARAILQDPYNNNLTEDTYFSLAIIMGVDVRDLKNAVRAEPDLPPPQQAINKCRRLKPLLQSRVGTSEQLAARQKFLRHLNQNVTWAEECRNAGI